MQTKARLSGKGIVWGGYPKDQNIDQFLLFGVFLQNQAFFTANCRLIRKTIFSGM
jgi:hypothetical protein